MTTTKRAGAIPPGTARPAKARSRLKKLALRTRQQGRELYTTVFSADELSEETIVPLYDPEKDTGYQRETKGARIRKLGRYIHEGGDLPTNVTVSIRNGHHERMRVRVLEPHGVMDLVELDIPEGVTLWLVDGQHRARGLEYARDHLGHDLDGFGLPATILVTQDELDEARTFRTIHREQKGVPTDLTDRLMAREFNRGRVDRAELIRTGQWKKLKDWLSTEVAGIMNDRPDSPWHQRLRPVHPERAKEEFAAAQGVKVKDVEVPWEVSLRSMSTSLKKAIEPLKTLSPEEAADVVIRYWKAAHDLCPLAAADRESYPYFHNTTGVYILNMIFPEVYSKAVFGDGATTANFKRIFARIGIDDDYFEKGGQLEGVGGMGGFKREADSLAAAL